MDIDNYKEYLDEHAIRFGECDMAIIGYDHNGFIVYSYDRLIAVFVTKGMTADEAAEYIEYNVMAINAGQNFTIVYS